MSFSTMKVSELKDVADYFAVDLDGVKGKPAILAALEEEGITFEMYSKFVSAEKAEPDLLPKQEKKAVPANANLVLVRMDRENPSYEINGHMFTREHPYVAMSEEDAEFIFETQEGFRMATPKEIQEYYN
jgi:hypothetical protein